MEECKIFPRRRTGQLLPLSWKKVGRRGREMRISMLMGGRRGRKRASEGERASQVRRLSQSQCTTTHR